MKMPVKRICIYAKDVERITGKSYRHSTRLLRTIRQNLGKKDTEFLTVAEFCAVTGLKMEQVEPFITG